MLVPVTAVEYRQNSSFACGLPWPGKHLWSLYSSPLQMEWESCWMGKLCISMVHWFGDEVLVLVRPCKRTQSFNCAVFFFLHILSLQLLDNPGNVYSCFCTKSLVILLTFLLIFALIKSLVAQDRSTKNKWGMRSLWKTIWVQECPLFKNWSSVIQCVFHCC